MYRITLRCTSSRVECSSLSERNGVKMSRRLHRARPQRVNIRDMFVRHTLCVAFSFSSFILFRSPAPSSLLRFYERALLGVLVASLSLENNCCSLMTSCAPDEGTQKTSSLRRRERERERRRSPSIFSDVVRTRMKPNRLNYRSRSSVSPS